MQKLLMGHFMFKAFFSSICNNSLKGGWPGSRACLVLMAPLDNFQISRSCVRAHPHWRAWFLIVPGPVYKAKKEDIG